MRCIVHYPNQSIYSKTKPLSETDKGPTYLLAVFMSKYNGRQKLPHCTPYGKAKKKGCSIHMAVQEKILKQDCVPAITSFSFYFQFNKTYYARYGSFYLASMKYIDVNYPWSKRNACVQWAVSARTREVTREASRSSPETSLVDRHKFCGRKNSSRTWYVSWWKNISIHLVLELTKEAL